MDEKNKKSALHSIIFAGFFTVVMLIGCFLPVKGFSQTENRYLAKKPKFSIEKLLDGTYGSDYETYLSDQFPMRDQWIGVKTIWERVMGKQDVNGVYFGKNDYYMERFDREDLDTELLWNNVASVSGFARRMSETLGENRVSVMLVPSASQILSDKLPFMAAPYDQNRILTRLREQAGEDLVVPADENLLLHKEEEIYYRTDHHWTTLGAYYGYEAWMNSIGMIPWPKEDFQVETAGEHFLGTIQSKVNVPMKADQIQLYRPRSSVSYKVYYDGSNEAVEDLYQYKALEGKDQYAIFLDGNHPWTKIVNENEGKGRKLLILKDSYANSLVPFAINHFEETHMIDLRYFNMNVEEFIQQQNITDILLLYQIPGFSKERTIYKLN